MYIIQVREASAQYLQIKACDMNELGQIKFRPTQKNHIFPTIAMRLMAA